MNWEAIERKWIQLRRSARKQWRRLTDDDLEVIGGEHEKLRGKLEERYGYPRERAEAAVEEWAEAIEHRPGQDRSAPR